VIKREVKLQNMLNTLIERNGYSRNRQPILDSIHVTAAALSQYARGRTRPSFDKLLALADFFDVSLDYLVYGEPTSTRDGPAPVARYVEQAFMKVQSRANRHSDLVARIGRLLADRIDNVAKEVVESRSAGMEGLIEDTEIRRVERHCRQADIVAATLHPNIIEMGGDKAERGQFFSVVVDNLVRGCRYRFLLTGDLTTQSQAVVDLREMIVTEVGGDRLHEFCFFRTAACPVAGTSVLYDLDTSTFAKAEPAIFAQFHKYLDTTWLGYLNRPNEESTADMVMAPSHVRRARVAFETMWQDAS
jgi:transcriptional regulator with XRE-family HTH domain